MIQQKLELQLKGLYTGPNNLSAIPQGALEVADNVVIDRVNIIESRRGQTQYGDVLSIGAGQVNKLFNYSTSLIAHYDNKLTYDSDGAGTWTAYSGTYLAPVSWLKMRSLQAQKNFYFTSTVGIYKIDGLTSTPKAAGVVRALSGTGTVSGNASGFLVEDSSVAYRIVWGYDDTNTLKTRILGAPSQRLIASNYTNNLSQVSLTFLIPVSIASNYFYQIYRSNGTLTAAAEPDDELQLVFQGTPTTGELSARSLTIVDITAYSLMRATIYTAPSQEGIANANLEPPLAVDMDVFKGYAFYANTTSKERLTNTLIGVGSPSLGYATISGSVISTNTMTGLIATAALVFQDLTYTAVAAGVSGNLISIDYNGGGTAGAEVVSVVGNAIAVVMQDGVSTATQIRTAINAFGAATALIVCSVSGAGAHAQAAAPLTYLAGGLDTSLLRKGMRIIRTSIPTDTRILAITSTSAITMTKNATATNGPLTCQFQDRVSIGNVDYWAGSANNVATNVFFASSAGSPGVNIDSTALNLLEIINTSASNTTLYGYYISSLDDLPGQMQFEERVIGGGAFNINSSYGAAFSPTVPDQKAITANSLANPTVVTSIAHGLSTGNTITIYNSNSTPTINGDRVVTVLTADTFSIPVNVTVAGTAGIFIITSSLILSSNENRQNRVYISKAGQVESVPIYTYFDIGSSNFAIQRVIALRDGIFFLKPDGIFRLSGESFSSFTVTLVDSTTALQVPESAVAFNNQVFCFADQGICAITDSGVEILSVPIENTLLELASSQYTNFQGASFGVAYESSRQYMFFTVTHETDVIANQAFVYNSLTKSWTRWVMSRTCGIVDLGSNKLHMAETDTGQIMRERKSFTTSDYADKQYAVVISSIDSSTTMTLSSITNVSVGMTIVQGGGIALITAIVGTVITVGNTTSFTAAPGDAFVYQPILNTITWAPIDCENPGILKQFSEVSFFFRNAAFTSIDAIFQSNILVEEATVTVTNNSQEGWGEFGWGLVPWGGVLGGQAVLRTYVPRNQQRCSWLTISLSTEESFTGFSLQGLSLVFSPMTSRIK